jgi:hypothetical protein
MHLIAIRNGRPSSLALLSHETELLKLLLAAKQGCSCKQILLKSDYIWLLVLEVGFYLFIYLIYQSYSRDEHTQMSTSKKLIWSLIKLAVTSKIGEKSW